jgi:hypothetical protein
MTPELIDELVSTADNVAALMVSLSPQGAADAIYNARASLFTVMSDAIATRRFGCGRISSTRSTAAA